MLPREAVAQLPARLAAATPAGGATAPSDEACPERLPWQAVEGRLCRGGLLGALGLLAVAVRLVMPGSSRHPPIRAPRSGCVCGTVDPGTRPG